MPVPYKPPDIEKILYFLSQKYKKSQKENFWLYRIFRNITGSLLFGEICFIQIPVARFPEQFLDSDDHFMRFRHITILE